MEKSEKTKALEELIEKIQPLADLFDKIDLNLLYNDLIGTLHYHLDQLDVNESSNPWDK